MMIDFKNFFLVALVFFILIVVGVWIPYERSAQIRETDPQPKDETAPGIVVDYNKEGFVPREISVKAGTRVGWANSSGGPMWVASDPHPSHTDLPGFDSRRALYLNDDSPFIKRALAHELAGYVYTFTKVGTWKYHNHLNPAHRGTVVVTE